MTQLRERMAERLEIPAGYWISYGGSFEHGFFDRVLVDLRFPGALEIGFDHGARIVGEGVAGQTHLRAGPFAQ